MAPPSPRRSSRARPTNSQSHQSSSSSGTSVRVDRNSRALNKTSSGKSTPSASLSSEPLEDFDDTLLGRRRKRGQDDEQEKTSRQDTVEMANGSDDLQDEEDEAVRCLCDAEEYPGRPPVEGADADFFAAIELTEDVTGFFVQCDVCKVWQHGACVGIFSAESSPDEYFCELCRKDLHKINTASNGQKYSKYLPLNRQSRPNSRATSIAKDRTQSPKNEKSKNLRPTSSSQSSKRRSTMNSRDAAYDDEQLRRAIEASKEDTSQDAPEGSIRRTKRGRSDSEENVPSVKRQRTNSQSQTPPAEQGEEPAQEQSEDEGHARNGTNKARNGRHQRERSEKEDKERSRQDAASKRKGRAERRRGEDSDPSEETPLAATKPSTKKSEEPPNTTEPQAAPQPTPGTPPTTHTTVGSSHKKGARSNHKKGKGKNQYTKDRDAEREESPARSMSRDIQKNTDEPNHHPKATSGEQKHSSKHKPAVAHKMSMLDMKRRVGAIMDFISRTQVDLAAEGSIGSNSNTTSGEGSPQKTPSAQLNGEAETAAAVREGQNGVDASDKDFKELNCMEMMDVLTRDMVKWQNQYT